MSTLAWILAGGFAMSLISWIGIVTLALKEELLNITVRYLVAFSAGSLIGGAFFHLLPETFEIAGPQLSMFVWLGSGFALLFLTEIVLNWHHCHEISGLEAHQKKKKPLGYLILAADGIHNFIGGMALGSSFLVSVPVGIITWLIEAGHEIPQELGDFGVLIYGGWEKKRALVWNFITALTILPGGIITYFAARSFDTTFLLAFAAGNFIYIAASDLIPEIKHGESLAKGLTHFITFLCGALFILLLKITFDE